MGFKFFVFILVAYCLQPSAPSKALSKERATHSNYTEIFFGDERTPFVALGPDILQSDDVKQCSQKDLRQANWNVLWPSNRQWTMLSQSGEKVKGLLLGFPLKALNRPLGMGAVVIDFSDHNNPYFQTPSYQEIESI